MSDLPPLDQSQAYVVVGPNDQRGPYTMELLVSEVLAGRLSEATPVWWPGLEDWTTMGGHPGVAAELARRRAASAPAAPVWADTSQQPAGQYAQPAPEQYAQPAPEQYAQPAPEQYAQPVSDYTPAQPEPSAGIGADPFGLGVPSASLAEEPGTSEILDQNAAAPHAEHADHAGGIGSDDHPVDAEVIEIDEVVAIDPQHHLVFAALVARSSVRAGLQARIDSVNDQLIEAVSSAVTDQGFSLGERVDADRGAELRFDGTQGDLVMVSMGRPAALRPEDLREDHVPITVSYRSGSGGGVVDAGSGSHGDVQVAADEWTGQSTSSVSLFIGLGDYLDDALSLNAAAVRHDIGATVAVLRERLS